MADDSAWADDGTHVEVIPEVAASPSTVRVGSSTADAQVIRVLSINCCLLPTGLRNRRLTLDGTVGGFGSAIVLWAALSYGLCAALWPRLGAIALAVVPLLFPFCLFFAFAFAIQFARLFRGALMLAACGENDSHDHKLERARGLVDKIVAGGYDAVVFQECYRAIPACGRQAPDEMFDALAERGGFAHAARSPGRSRASMCMDSGLAIVSKWPIVQTSECAFGAQTFATKWCVSRAALHAAIRVTPAGGEPIVLDVFTMHIEATAEVGGHKQDSSVHRAVEKVRHAQIAELTQFVARETAGDGVGGERRATIVIGDFNADISWPEGPDGAPKYGEAYRTVHEAMSTLSLRDTVEMKDKATGAEQPAPQQDNPSGKVRRLSARRPSYGHGKNERLLTGYHTFRLLAGKTDDLCFYNPAQLTLDSSDYIEMTTPTPVGAFTHLTDHWGVGVGLKIGGSA